METVHLEQADLDVGALVSVTRLAIRDTRYYHIHRRKVPLTEVYPSISENFPAMYTGEAEASRRHQHAVELR